MKAKFEAYSLELQEVLIGTPRAPARRPDDREHPDPAALAPGRARAGETYQEQEKAAVQERALNEAKATAAAQTALTQSLIQVKVQRERGRGGACARAEGCRDREGDGGRGRREVAARGPGRGRSRAGGRHARMRRRPSSSVDAYGGPEFRLAEQNFARFADALTKINQPLVPQFLMSGGAGPGGQQRRPDSDRDAELDVRPDDAGRAGKAEGRGAATGIEMRANRRCA